MQFLGGVWARRGLSTRVGFSRQFAEDRVGHLETFAGAVGEERSKELGLDGEKEEEEGLDLLRSLSVPSIL